MRNVRLALAEQEPAFDTTLAWELAGLCALDVPVAVPAIVASRLIDASACAAAALDRPPVVNARASALARPSTSGATVFGAPADARVDCAAAAAANATAIRDLDFNDSFFAADTAHPSDSIAAVLAVAQACGRDGSSLIRGIAAAYAAQIALASAIPLIRLQLDQSTHLAPAMACGICSLLDLDRHTATHAISLAAHCGVTTRQGRTGADSSWKSAVPGFSAHIAINAVDRAMRGERSPSAVYEGPQGLLAMHFGGPDAQWTIPIPDQHLDSICMTYPKQHAVGYASQAFIDLAFSMRECISDFESIKTVDVHTCGHHHRVHGSGSADADSMRPGSARESLDHSIMYAFTVALEDGVFEPHASYSTERSTREHTVRLWQKTRTHIDPAWDDAYENASCSLDKAQGGRVEIGFADGSVLVDELRFPHAHPRGRSPFGIGSALRKFEQCTAGRIAVEDAERFVALVTRLESLAASEIQQIALPRDRAPATQAHGIYDWT